MPGYNPTWNPSVSTYGGGAGTTTDFSGWSGNDGQGNDGQGNDGQGNDVNTVDDTGVILSTDQITNPTALDDDIWNIATQAYKSYPVFELISKCWDNI